VLACLSRGPDGGWWRSMIGMLHFVDSAVAAANNDYRRTSPLLTKKVQEKVLILHPVTSLDDAIDLSNS